MWSCQVSRYLQFARMFKPKVEMEAQELLVQQYKHLRQVDGNQDIFMKVDIEF